MPQRVWVGGSGNWSDTAHWSTVPGGGGGSSVPSLTDNVVIDNNAGGLNGGTLTVNQTISVQNIIASSMVGTFDNSAGHPITCSGTAGNWMSFSGTTARTINMGTSLITLTGSAPTFNLFTMATITGLTNPTTAFANCTLSLTNTSNTAAFVSTGGLTYGTIFLNGHANKGGYYVSGNNPTITTLNINGPNSITIGSTPVNVTNAVNISETPTTRVLISNIANSGVINIVSANNWNVSNCYIKGLNMTGGGTFTATNSFDLGGNSGWSSITEPAGGGESFGGFA